MSACITLLEAAETLKIAVENLITDANAGKIDHNSVLMKMHPYPCNMRDWCVVSDAKRRLREALPIIEASR